MNRISLKWLLVGVMGIFSMAGVVRQAGGGEQVVIEQPETAGISGHRLFWNLPVVLKEGGKTVDHKHGNVMQAPMAIWSNLNYHGGYGKLMVPKHMKNAEGKRVPFELQSVVGPIVFDAVHRSVLVRFPEAAKQIAEKVRAGFAIEKAELSLPFKATEKISRMYKGPSSFLMKGKHWDKITPRWHAIAYLLRKPWAADKEIGPTFNAYNAAGGYWAQYGAQDPAQDRFPKQFGPAEVSKVKSETLDVTACFADNAFGKTLGERLRAVADCGFLVRKLEYYDMAFGNPGYEWGVMTGGRGIFVQTPKLIVTFKKGDQKVGDLPTPADPKAMAATLKDKPDGKPTCAMPTPEEFEALKKTYGFKQPDWMDDWMWTRVQEDYNLPGHANNFPDTLEKYGEWLDQILTTQPRRWEGFEAVDQLFIFYMFKDALPQYVIDHWKLYWTAWLMPHRPSNQMVHNQYHQIYTKYRNFGSSYYDKTGDWKGNQSFYRASYTRIMSTMNFNHTAAVGALLGGAFIGSDYAVEDGRFGIEHFPVRLWAWYDGTTQETVDHYYLAHTLTAQKMLADFSPTQYDRLMGRSALFKSIDELTCLYHPHLRRFISSSGRTAPEYVLQNQDGLQAVINTLSKEGAYTDTDIAKRKGGRDTQLNQPTVIGKDLPPRRVAMQTLKSPWGPPWMSHTVDKKQLPFQTISTWRQWGAFRGLPKFNVSYLANHYGVASRDLVMGTVNLLCLWRRNAEKVKTAQSLGALLMRYGWNRTNFIDTHRGGTAGVMGGAVDTFQHTNKLLALSSPYYELKSSHYDPKKQPIKSLQTTIALLSVLEKPAWEIYIDGKKIDALPVKAKTGSVITIKDGVSYIGIRPLPATDLGRDAEVELLPGGEPVTMQSGGKMTEGLIINNYNYRNDTPLDLKTVDWDKIDKAHGGFVMEMGDASEYPSFEAFQKHIGDAKLTLREEGEVLHAMYNNGKNKMECSYRPANGAKFNDRTPPQAIFPDRKVDGKWPYLADGVERETPVSIQGRLGRLEKNGAVLTVEPGVMGHLVTEPISGTYCGVNPLPDATHYRLEVPGGVRVDADGKVALTRVTIRPKENRVWIDYATPLKQSTDGMAANLYVFGLSEKPQVTLNGAAVGDLAQAMVEGKKAWVVPITKEKKAPATKLAGGWEKGADIQVARMLYEKGHEHYLLTRPEPKVWAFQRLWPSGSCFRASVPEGLTLTADGRLGFRYLTMSGPRNRIELDAPKYMYTADGACGFTEKAKALFIYGTKVRPTLVFNTLPYEGPMEKTTLGGEEGWVVPLYDIPLEEAKQGLQERYKAAQQKIVDPDKVEGGRVPHP